MKHSLWITAAVLLSGPALLSPASAEAQVNGIVGEFSGSGASRVRSRAVSGLEDHMELTPQADLPDGLSSDGDYAAAAAETGVSAIIEGTVNRRGRRWTAVITVRGGDGGVAGEATFQGRNLTALSRRVQADIWDDLGDTIESAPQPDAGGDDEEFEGGDEGDFGGGGSVRVVVLDFEGSRASRARAAVVGLLEDEDSIELVELDEADEMASELDVDLNSEDGLAEVSAALNINTWIAGEVEREGRSYTALIRVINGADGSEMISATYEGRGSSPMVESIRENFWGELSDTIMSGESPGGGGGGDDEDDEDDEEDEYDGPEGPRPSPLTIGAYLRLFTRDLTYNDDIRDALREYSLPLGPALDLDLQWYPAAHFTGGVAANLGLDVRFQYAFAITSTDSTMKEFPTSSLAWSIGARFRIPAGEHELYMMAGYGTHSYRIEAIDATNPAPEVPDVDYGFLRLGAGFRGVFGPVSAELRLAYLLMLSTGQFGEEDWWMRQSGGGLEAMIRLGFEVTDGLEVQAAFHMQRYGFSLNPEVGDPLIAGGALDQYLSGTFGIAYRLDGSE